MGKFFDTLDFPGVTDAGILIEDAEALAVLVAPCLEAPDLSNLKRSQAKAILRGAILRWSDAGNGVASQQNAGPFGVTTTPQVRRNSFWPSEIKDLQKVCKGNTGRAFAVDLSSSELPAY